MHNDEETRLIFAAAAAADAIWAKSGDTVRNLRNLLSWTRSEGTRNVEGERKWAYDKERIRNAQNRESMAHFRSEEPSGALVWMCMYTMNFMNRNEKR